MPSTVPAAQYLRMSNEHQQYSLIHQAEKIQAYAQGHGFEIVRTFSDAGRSGVRLKDRPGLMRLLNEATSGDAVFKAVLVYDVSRWGRFQDCDEAAHYEFICKSANVPVHYCGESFLNNNTLTNSIVKALKRTMAAEYSREMGVRVFAGAKKLAELGFKQGGAPGYGLRRLMVSAVGHQRKTLTTGEMKSLRTDRVILVPGPAEEVECVREMYRLLVEENRSPFYITNELNRRGVKSPTERWRLMTVLRILTNPKYAGYNVWNRSSSRLGSRKVPTATSNWVSIPGAFKPVVDPQLFEKAQGVLANQKKPYSREYLLESLRGLLREHGTLSYPILKNSPDVASEHTFRKHFGTLRRAFELAGHKRRSALPTPEQMRVAKQLRAQLISKVTSLNPLEVSVFCPDSNYVQCLKVDGKLAVSVVVCPAMRRSHSVNWFVDNRWTKGTTVTLLARLTSDNLQLRDLFVVQMPSVNWIRRRGELKQCRQLEELSEFCTMVRAVVSHG